MKDRRGLILNKKYVNSVMLRLQSFISQVKYILNILLVNIVLDLLCVISYKLSTKVFISLTLTLSKSRRYIKALNQSL